MSIFQNGNLSNEEKNNLLSRISFGLNILKDTEINGYKLISFNMKDDNVVFSNGTKEEKTSIKKMLGNLPYGKIEHVEKVEKKSNVEISKPDLQMTETTEMIKQIRNEPFKSSETSAMVGGYGNTQFSETSGMYEISDVSDVYELPEMTGGFKNIFQKIKYSETSSLDGESGISNISATSSVIFNGRSDKYSDTSALDNQTGGLKTFTSDTLMDISELKQRKTQSKTTNLDLGIFTKKSQLGGSVDSLKRKMNEMGIGSNSSTSSICE